MDFTKKLDSNLSIYLKRPDVPQGIWNRLVNEYFDINGYLYFCTSGTTSSNFKIIKISNKILLDHSKKINNHFKITNQDIWLNCLPNYYMGGIAIHFRAYQSGSKVIECSTKDIKELFKIIDIEKVTHLSLVPYQVHQILELEIQLPKSIKMIFIGGDRLSLKSFNKLQKLSDVFYPTYGLSELCSQVATSRLDRYNTFDILPWNNCNIEDGILNIKSPFYYEGQYLVKDEQVTFEKFDSDIFKTQDFAVIDKNELKILGRSDRNIKVLGKFVNLDQIESDLSLKTDIPFFITSKSESNIGSIPIAISKIKIPSEILDEFNIRESIIVEDFKYTYSKKLIKKIDSYL